MAVPGVSSPARTHSAHGRLNLGKDIWEQAATLLQEVPGSLDALDVLEECERAAKECGGLVAWNEMGINCGEKGAKPVLIL